MLQKSILNAAALVALLAGPGVLPAWGAAAGDTLSHSPTQSVVVHRLLDPAILNASAAQDTGRPRAVHYSDAYYTRLTIHRVGSYAMLPLFAGEYLLGNELLNGTNVAPWVRPTHRFGAGAIGALFAVNTITGVWNFVESRKEPEGRARKFLHMALMLASDAGFAYTSAIGGGHRRLGLVTSDAIRHRNAALVSMGFATAGTLVMWLWKD